MPIRSVFAQFATNIFDIPCFADYENTALAGIGSNGRLFRSIHMPTNLHDLGLDLTDDRFMNWLSNAVLKIHVPIGVFKTVKHEKTNGKKFTPWQDK